MPIIASSMERKRGSGVRYCPRAIRCKAVTIERAGASACAIASEAKSAIATDIRSATSITLRMYSQASEIAAAGSGVATTVPAAAARGLTGRTTSA